MGGVQKNHGLSVSGVTEYRGVVNKGLCRDAGTEHGTRMGRNRVLFEEFRELLIRVYIGITE